MLMELMCLEPLVCFREASIHMPRIGLQGGGGGGSQRSEWYTIERLLRKYSSLHGVDIFV